MDESILRKEFLEASINFSLVTETLREDTEALNKYMLYIKPQATLFFQE